MTIRIKQKTAKVPICIRLTQEEANAFDTLCIEREMTQGEAMRYLLMCAGRIAPE